MSLADSIKAVLVADAGAGGVNTLCTGGIYTFDDTKRLGISRQTTSGAFDSTTQQLKPCCVIKGRDEVLDGGARDNAVASYRQVYELWFYDQGNATTATISAASSRAFAVLDGQMIGDDSNILHFAGTYLVNRRDAALDQAHIRRADYAVRGLM